MKVSNSRSSSGVSAGRVSKRRDLENEEVQMYIAKLQELVPYMPKDKKLSKLAVIHNVIRYICDLQTTLQTTSAPAAEATVKSPSRQPLGVIAPNTIVSSSPCSTQEVPTTPIHMLEKVGNPSDIRPVSV